MYDFTVIKNWKTIVEEQKSADRKILLNLNIQKSDGMVYCKYFFKFYKKYHVTFKFIDNLQKQLKILTQ